jgi:hypothetical protein
MKQLLSLFLFLLPCLAWAQYPSNGNQKITLGEQTTADGLIYRGVAADTTLTVKSDTAAYFVLDTVNINLYTYKASATGRKWRQLGADTAAIAYVNTYGTQTVNGAKTFNNNIIFKDESNGFTIAQGTGGNTGYSGFWHNSVNLDQTKYNLITNGSTLLLNSQTTISLAINDSGKLNARSFGADVVGNFGIGINPPEEKLDVNGNARIRAVGAGAYSNDLNITSTGVLTTASSSDETFKYNINPITYGLSTILQLKPVSFQWKKGDEHDLGFIAQDAVNIIPEAVDTFWDSSLLFRSNTIIPILTKAIQEQNLLIKALEQRIINLENK